MSKQIFGINGPVITVADTADFFMQEMVYVGNLRLVGEVIGIKNGTTTIQVYESTTGLKVGEPVVNSGRPLSLSLGPGILGGIFDGIERPLRAIEADSGPFISRGTTVTSLDLEKKWSVTVNVKVGDTVEPGLVFARCPETPSIEYRAMIPSGVSGKVKSAVSNGEYNVTETIIEVETEKGTAPLTLCQSWPIRHARPVKKRLSPTIPLITGQRIIDSMFPLAKGGTAAIPGGFGTGKTMTQHQLAKWSDADIIIYVGCGERGNEMTQVLDEFGGLVDPRTGRELKDRTVLIANTSNMPVAAREASIYTGITLGEFYRDMGYHVAMMADSTSRWAEALREISGRLEEMPAEEGFPAYLPSRLSAFYERAGMFENLNGTTGSITVIGAVSPQGADFSEPVTQNTKRFVRCFWALDKSLAYARHYPAINWLTSYSDYETDLTDWFESNVAPDYMALRTEILSLLRQENELMEIVKLIGSDVLPDSQKLIIETAKIIRTGLLQQNAYHKDDTYIPLPKQHRMMKIMVKFYNRGSELITAGIPISRLTESGQSEKLIRMKFDIPNDRIDMFDDYEADLDSTVDSLLRA